MVSYYLKPIPEPGKDHSKLNGYRILIMQNTTRKLMERTVARKLAQDLERRNVLPQTKEDAEQEKPPGKTQPDSHTISGGRNKLWHVAVDLEDAYNRVPFKLLMELLVQYGTMGLPQGSPLSPILYNVYTKGLADLNGNGLSRVLTLADDGLIYKTASDISTAVTAVQEHLEKV